MTHPKEDGFSITHREGELANLIASRIGQDFDGECRLTEAEAGDVIRALASRPAMEAVAWREKVARIIDPAAFMLSPGELDDKVYSASRAHAFDRADRIIQALAVIPTQGLDSSAEGADTQPATGLSVLDLLADWSAMKEAAARDAASQNMDRSPARYHCQGRASAFAEVARTVFNSSEWFACQIAQQAAPARDTTAGYEAAEQRSAPTQAPNQEDGE